MLINCPVLINIKQRFKSVKNKSIWQNAGAEYAYQFVFDSVTFIHLFELFLGPLKIWLDYDNKYRISRRQSNHCKYRAIVNYNGRLINVHIETRERFERDFREIQERPKRDSKKIWSQTKLANHAEGRIPGCFLLNADARLLKTWFLLTCLTTSRHWKFKLWLDRKTNDWFRQWKFVGNATILRLYDQWLKLHLELDFQLELFNLIKLILAPT